MRATGFPDTVRRQVMLRCEGICERCGGHRVQELHHRRPRAKGGTRRPETNLPANALALCGDCHWWVEHNRTRARDYGLLVEQGHEPAMVKVLYRGRWARLDDDGGVTPLSGSRDAA